MTAEQRWVLPFPNAACSCVGDWARAQSSEGVTSYHRMGPVGQLTTACLKSLSKHWAGNWVEVPSKVLSPPHVWLLPTLVSNEINNELRHLFTRECITHDGQGTWCGYRAGVLTWNICIMGFGHFPDQFYFTLSWELAKSWPTMRIAVTCLCKEKPFCPIQKRITSPQQMASSTDLMEGNSRAFPAWPNEPEAYETGGGRKRGRGLGQNGLHCWIWAIKGNRSWRYKCFSPSEFGCDLPQDCHRALTILSQELGRVKGQLSSS